MNKHRLLIPLYGGEALGNLALSIILIGPYGLAGVALGTLIPSLIVNLGFIPRYLARTTGTSATLFYRNCWLLPVLACLPFALANLLLEQYLPPGNLAVLFLQIFLTLPLVTAGAAALCLTPAEKKQVGSVIRKVVAMAR
jgi:O-antigen/teichoic acid export membrane protein